MTTGSRIAVQAALWSGYVAVSLAMIAAFQVLTGSMVFVMALVGAGLWAASEGLRAQALGARWLDLPPRALLPRLLFMPPLLALGV